MTEAVAVPLARKLRDAGDLGCVGWLGQRRKADAGPTSEAVQCYSGVYAFHLCRLMLAEPERHWL
ncbi:hypothetical protein [Mesorhizobium sp. B2-4-17]|uniref:hypothetical protein n=1 Tax=Mesorhizobium sp. B2-4-17 TaxID=2589932 RepID=UPI0015E3A881|nr:hypothetical protein [Mesorhizobium sp. B2-4-17]